MFKIGFFQFNPKFGQVSANLAHVLKSLDGIDADVLVLPELAFTGYYFKDREELVDLAEQPGASKTVAELTSFCRDHQLHIVTGFAEKHGEKVFNSALLIGPGGLLHTYRKLHLFSTEKDYFDPGDTPPAVVTVNGVNLGLMICFDWVFPEMARCLALSGADVLCHPSNLVLTFCQNAMITRSIENAVFTVTANRCGTEVRPHGTLNFSGKSQITGPKGGLLGRAASNGDHLCVVEIDPEKARDKYLTPQNDLMADRRPAYYGRLTRQEL